MVRVRDIAQVGWRRDRFKLLGDSIVPTLEPKPFASTQGGGGIPRLVAVKYERTAEPDKSSGRVGNRADSGLSRVSPLLPLRCTTYS